jgi:hypothetical protein
MAIDLTGNKSRPLTTSEVVASGTTTVTWDPMDYRVHIRATAALTWQVGAAGTPAPAPVPADADTWVQIHERHPFVPTGGSRSMTATVTTTAGQTLYVAAQGNGQ